MLDHPKCDFQPRPWSSQGFVYYADALGFGIGGGEGSL
jgi:hypothetical protein